MAVTELKPTSPIGLKHPLTTDKSAMLNAFDPASVLAGHAAMHEQDGIFIYSAAPGRDPGTGNTVTVPWDVPFPLTVLSIFFRCGTIPATSVALNVSKGATTLLTNGPATLLNAGGNNQKTTIEPASGPSTTRLSAALADLNDNETLNCAFTQTGAGTLTDMLAILTCRRRFT